MNRLTIASLIKKLADILEEEGNLVVVVDNEGSNYYISDDDISTRKVGILSQDDSEYYEGDENLVCVISSDSISDINGRIEGEKFLIKGFYSK